MTEAKTTVLALESADAKIILAHALTHSNSAHKYASGGNLDLADKFIKATRSLLDICGESDNEVWMNYYWARSSVLQHRKQFEEALAMARKSLAIARRLPSQASWSIIVAETNIGDLLGEMGQKESACAVIADGIARLTACDVGTEKWMHAWRDATLKEFAGNLAKYSS